MSVLGYADDLKLFMAIKCIGDCQLFQRDLDRLGEWCRGNKFDLKAVKFKSICFCCNMRPIEFVYSIDGTALERVDETDGRKNVVFASYRGNYFRDSYTHKTPYTSLVRPNLEHVTCV
jgi:hypothetical protein